MGLAIHLYFESSDSSDERLCDVLFACSPENWFRAKLAWIRAWQRDNPNAAVSTYYGLEKPADPVIPWDDTNPKLVYPEEYRREGISFSDCRLPDCSREVAGSIRQLSNMDWRAELRGTVAIVANVLGLTQSVRVCRELAPSSEGASWPVLEVGLDKSSTVNAFMYELTILSFSTAWYFPISGSGAESVIDEAAADQNLQQWADWTHRITSQLRGVLKGGEISMGLRGALREQESRVLNCFLARIPQLTHAWV